MAKSGSTGNKNLLRIAGIWFGIIGVYHVLRSQGISLQFVELTRLGSLIYGISVLLLSALCFLNSRK